MIAGLDEDQLEKLERIMSKDLDSATEFQMLHDELVEMGMDEEDVQDLLDLSKMMVQFVSLNLFHGGRGGDASQTLFTICVRGVLFRSLQEGNILPIPGI